MQIEIIELHFVDIKEIESNTIEPRIVVQQDYRRTEY
jgi:hypothetical protein